MEAQALHNSRCIKASNSSSCVWARILECIGTLVGVVHQLDDERNIVDIVNTHLAILKSGCIIFNKHLESSSPAERQASFIASSWKLSRIAGIFDGVTSFSFDGDDAFLRLALRSGKFVVRAHDSHRGRGYRSNRYHVKTRAPRAALVPAPRLGARVPP